MSSTTFNLLSGALDRTPARQHIQPYRLGLSDGSCFMGNWGDDKPWENYGIEWGSKLWDNPETWLTKIEWGKLGNSELCQHFPTFGAHHQLTGMVEPNLCMTDWKAWGFWFHGILFCVYSLFILPILPILPISETPRRWVSVGSWTPGRGLRCVASLRTQLAAGHPLHSACDLKNMSS